MIEVNVEKDDPVQVDMPEIVSDQNYKLKDLPKFELLKSYQYFSKKIIMLLSILNNYYDAFVIM